MDVLETKKADEDSVVDDYGATFDEEYVYFSVMADESTTVAEEKYIYVR